ncbi:MAG: hypothetical protein QW303_04080 [Nitrososphaerota archaeon]
MKSVKSRLNFDLLSNKNYSADSVLSVSTTKELGKTYYIIKVKATSPDEWFKPEIYDFVEDFMKLSNIKAFVDKTPTVVPATKEGEVISPDSSQRDAVDHFVFTFKCPSE